MVLGRIGVSHLPRGAVNAREPMEQAGAEPDERRVRTRLLLGQVADAPGEGSDERDRRWHPRADKCACIVVDLERSSTT
jgi:hypothetical protein